MYTLQFTYVTQLFIGSSESVKSAANISPFFIFHNLLMFGFIHLWCRSYFWQALLLAVVNWLQLTVGYFRYPNSPNSQHVAVFAMPLAFAYVTLFWDGACAVHAHHVGARIVANVFVWTWVVYGGFYLVVFKDWAMGFSLSVLAAGMLFLKLRSSSFPNVFHSAWCFAVLDCSHRPAMDLRIHDHGDLVPRIGCRRCSWHCGRRAIQARCCRQRRSGESTSSWRRQRLSTQAYIYVKATW